jgi:hypothetical protein
MYHGQHSSILNIHQYLSVGTSDERPPPDKRVRGLIYGSIPVGRSCIARDTIHRQVRSFVPPLKNLLMWASLCVSDHNTICRTAILESAESSLKRWGVLLSYSTSYYLQRNGIRKPREMKELVEKFPHLASS